MYLTLQFLMRQNRDWTSSDVHLFPKAPASLRDWPTFIKVYHRVCANNSRTPFDMFDPSDNKRETLDNNHVSSEEIYNIRHLRFEEYSHFFQQSHFDLPYPFTRDIEAVGDIL